MPDHSVRDNRANDDEPRAPDRQLPGAGLLPESPHRLRTFWLCVGFLVPCAVLALSIFSMVRDTQHGDGGVPVARGTGMSPSDPSAAMGATGSGPSLGRVEVPQSEYIDETDDGEPRTRERAPSKRYSTVQQAAIESCSTASVDGLSRQIIDQARCIKPNAFVPLPGRPNLVLGSNVFPFLELATRDHLVRALDARSGGKMTINSALRTVVQQYLVWRWAKVEHCGVQLATPPGQSNHEMGVALDIAEAADWRSALEAQEFRWLGASDRVHFDFRGNDSLPRSATDVLAFQILWNRNHPRDAIVADGHYSPATEQRLKKAPPNGFPIGPACSKVTAARNASG